MEANELVLFLNSSSLLTLLSLHSIGVSCFVWTSDVFVYITPCANATGYTPMVLCQVWQDKLAILFRSISVQSVTLLSWNATTSLPAQYELHFCSTKHGVPIMKRWRAPVALPFTVCYMISVITCYVSFTIFFVVLLLAFDCFVCFVLWIVSFYSTSSSLFFTIYTIRTHWVKLRAALSWNPHKRGNQWIARPHRQP